MTTKHDRLFTSLWNGEGLTEAQIRNRFGLANPRAAISYLRSTAPEVEIKAEHPVKNGRQLKTRYVLSVD